jgi:glucosamine-6-phosphate deaminase
MKSFVKDKLTVKIYDTRDEMGMGAGEDIAAALRTLLAEREEVNVIFAAAPSQNEALASLVEKDIDWSRVNAFHMDEYIGLEKDAPQRFSRYLDEHVFSLVPFKAVYRIDPSGELEGECRRYSELLRAFPVDLVVMGIGENGHIAFNDPPVANFHDTALVKPVKLDEACRLQQVHDGCFDSISLVPTHALTLTCPALMSARYKFCVVPAATKAEAVRRTLSWDISEACPATVLRDTEGATLYLDADSSSLI